MQAYMGGAVSGGEVVAGYAYAARYLYSGTVTLNDNFLRISAYEDDYQKPMSSEVMITPAARPVKYNDRLGNLTHRVRVRTPHQEMLIFAIGAVRLQPVPPEPEDIPLSDLSYEQWPDELDNFLAPSPMIAPERLADTARDIAGGAPTLMGVVKSVIDWIYANIAYMSGSTNVATTAEQALVARQGVCQDMAHLALGMLRALGIPARYASGLMGDQVGETHAWLDFLHPTLGWLPSDPTRGQPVAAGMDFVKFAIGRDYNQVSPVEGTYISMGSGGLDIAQARIFPDEDDVSFDDAQRLIENVSGAKSAW